MLDFNEKLLQFIWQSRLIKAQTLFTTSGNEVVIIKTGTLNTDAGPDFFNGQIRLNGLILAGNIELHLKTSDWLKHGHQHNKSYDNIILHVVYAHDLNLAQNTNNAVEVLELKNYIPEPAIKMYQKLITSVERLPCASQLKHVNDLKFIGWMERMAVERLEEKTKRIEQVFTSFNNDYTQTFYSVLMRNFGFKVNGLPFELISKHLPISILLKHADNLLQLEALLFGVSGLLEDQFKDKYVQSLQNEFAHLKNKYAITVLQKELFKFSRLRPANFPTVRLAQFAALIHAHPELFVNPQFFTDQGYLKIILKPVLQGYWSKRYLPDGKILSRNLVVGENAAENIIINTMAPFFFFYSKKLLKPQFAELAIKLLEHSSFENNFKTRLFVNKRSLLKTGADSQAIVNLYDNYCIAKQCLKCGIGSNLLNAPAAIRSL